MAITLTDEFKTRLAELIAARRMADDGRWSEAADAYESLAGSGTSRADALVALAHARFQEQLYESGFTDEMAVAISLVEEAISERPEDAWLHFKLGWYRQWVSSDYEGALTAYERAIDLDRHLVDALVAAAEMYGMPEEVIALDTAITYAERAATIAPEAGLHWHLLARLHASSGNAERVEHALERAALSPAPFDVSELEGMWIERGPLSE